MARRFLRLKFALVKNGFRTGSTPMIIGSVLSLLAAAIAGLAGLVGGVALRWAPDDVRQLIVPIALAVVLLIWLVGPITVAGSDASMDPVKLVVLPLSRRQLVIGLTLSALIGPGGLATVPAVVGLVIGTAPLGPGALAVVGGGVLFILLCAVASRLLITLVGLGLRRRGLRDVLGVAIPLMVVLLSQLPNLINNVVLRGHPERAEELLERLRLVLRLWPSSFSASMITAGAQGRGLRALAEAAGALATVTLLGAVWAVLLRRVMTSPPTTGTVRAHRGRRPRLARLMPWLPRRAAAVADKDLTLMLREPAQRVQLILATALTLAAAVIPVLTGVRAAAIGYLGCGLAVFLGMINSNVYGYDGSSMWVNVAAGDDARSDLLGKATARLVVFTPAVVVVALVLGVSARPALLPGVLGCTIGAWCLATGLGLLQSVIAPYPVSYSENGVMARNNGSFTAFVAQLVALPVLAVGIGPFIVVGLVWSDRPGLVAGSGAAALVIGAGAGYGLYRAAVRYSAPRQAELLVSISKKAEA
ncbi:MAG: hypothetical protein IPJ14_01350 [Kineosporiaceae bacterium]|nr:hypothetical protein [Kineosporiaceae bacterium]